jgi:hypothetical protein
MEGVLSAGVEYTSIGARPLVRVYSRRRLRAMMDAAGFAEVDIHARHFHLVDTPVTHPLRRLRWAHNGRVLDRIGRIGGWYVIGRGIKR